MKMVTDHSSNLRLPPIVEWRGSEVKRVPLDYQPRPCDSRMICSNRRLMISRRFS